MAQGDGPTIHTVAAGETLSAIARQYGVTAQSILDANALADPDAIIEGQALLIPSVRPAATDAPGVHTVLAGETLSAIARRYGISAAALSAANGIADPNALYAGQILQVPGLAGEPTAAPAPTVAPASPVETATETPAVHTVAVGETLSAIARRYGFSVADLLAANNLADANNIFSGQILQLPTVAGEPPAGARPAVEPATLAPTPQPSAPPAADAAVAEEPPAAVTNQPVTTFAPEPLAARPGVSLNQSYQVRFGDTLTLIALRTGVDLESLRRLNGFGSIYDPLNAGDALLLPATGDELRPVVMAPVNSADLTYYTVAPGDSLSAIAVANGLTLGELMSANRIADPNAIYSGQQLIIPEPLAANPNDTTPAPEQIGPARNGYYYYTVQRGDTLSALAKEFNSTMQALRDYNGLPDNDSVYTGLELKVPFGTPPIPQDLPPTPLSGSRFMVSISRQQCWLYQGDYVRYYWNCSTGQDDHKTKPGTYAVQSKIENAKSNAYRLDIYDVGKYENGIHGLPVAWSTGQKIWNGLIGQPATFGCAMLNDPDAATLFRNAFVGMPVHVLN
jgi:peptidoglycan endopeptidase LytF